MNNPGFTRREFLHKSGTFVALAVLAPSFLSAQTKSDGISAIDIGSRLELMVDDFLIEQFGGKAGFLLHHPEPHEIVLVHDAKWEGSGCGYHSVFKDGDLYRMYYKSWHLDVQPPGKVKTNAHPLFCCYAESKDGINWYKPDLGLLEFNGSKKNNIIIAPGKAGMAIADPGHPAVFKDENPDCPADARYKAVILSSKPHGLLAFKSADGLHWSLMSDKPVITEGAFDSQNLAFWDPVRGEYRAYWRIFTGGVTDGTTWKPAGIRAIRTATSRDFLKWGPHEDLTYVDSPPDELYTNQIKPYYRAPHIFIGFPTRYIDRDWSDSMKILPEPDHRQMRSKASKRYGTAITEGLMMTSRDGRKFKRWNEAFLRPGIERNGTWNYGHQYIAWHVVETKSSLEGAPNELSLYATESYWTGNSSEVRRYTLRMDGFVSINAPMNGGEFVTKPLIFKGDKLVINFSTSAAGSVQIEIQDTDGSPLPGSTLNDCPPIFGDSIERTVTWKTGSDVSRLAGKPVRLKFVLKDSDIFALRFV